MKKCYTIEVDYAGTIKKHKTFNEMQAFAVAEVKSIPVWVNYARIYFGNEYIAQYKNGEKVSKNA